MAVYDDPVFVKALKLLHSPAKDSATQIRHLLEEVFDQKYGGTKTLNLKFHNAIEESSTSLEVPKAKGSRGSSPVFLGIGEKSSRSSTPPSESVSIKLSPDRDDDDILEIFKDDLFCTVCKGIRVTSDNRLLECKDCHSLYHQECHKPPVESDANDPSMIWSCGDCTRKNQEKVSVKVKSSESTYSKLKSDNETSESSTKKQKADDSSHLDPPPKKHKSDSDRSDSKSGHKKSEKNSNHSSRNSHTSSKSSSNSSSSSSKSESRSSKTSGSNLNFNKPPGSPNGKTPSCTANIIAADRRLQNMKKKAAAKMQEKRSNPK